MIKIGKLTPKSPRNTLFPTDLDMVYFCLRAPRAATRPPKITLKIRPQKNTRGKKTSNKQNRQEHLEKDFGKVPTGRRFPTQITPTSSFFPNQVRSNICLSPVYSPGIRSKRLGNQTRTFFAGPLFSNQARSSKSETCFIKQKTKARSASRIAAIFQRGPES